MPQHRDDEDECLEDFDDEDEEDLDQDQDEPFDEAQDKREALDYRSDFARVLRGDWITGFLAVNSLAALVWAIFAEAGVRIAMLILGAVAAAAAIGFNHINWRCPGCNERIPRDVGDNCPHCAARLR